MTRQMSDLDGRQWLSELLPRLRQAYDALLIAEVNRCHGIPSLRPEELALREVLAELLAGVTEP